MRIHLLSNGKVPSTFAAGWEFLFLSKITVIGLLNLDSPKEIPLQKDAAHAQTFANRRYFN